MSGVEIIFTISTISLLVTWGWFILLGFRTSRIWGAGLIFLFPISPFMFAYRFERKTRQAISYFIGTLAFFILLMLYIYFTDVEFFSTFSQKISKSLPRLELSFKSKKVKPLNLPPPTPIPPPRTVVPEQTTETIIKAPPVSAPSRRYKTIDIGSAQNYVGKNVIITTAIVEHRGKLTSVDNTQIEIRKQMEGGSILMGIKKSKIEKLEVYL